MGFQKHQFESQIFLFLFLCTPPYLGNCPQIFQVFNYDASSYIIDAPSYHYANHSKYFILDGALYLLGDTEKYEDVGVEDDATGPNDHKVHGAQQEYLRELAMIIRFS